MKKETLISALILAIGLSLDFIYLQTESTFWGIKIYLIGVICTVVGFIGLWKYAIMPFLNKQFGDK